MTVNVADLVESVTEVAVNVAVPDPLIVDDALYVVEVVVEPVSAPRPDTADQFTPALLGSLVTVAVTNCVLPRSSVAGLRGENPMVIAGLIVILS